MKYGISVICSIGVGGRLGRSAEVLRLWCQIQTFRSLALLEEVGSVVFPALGQVTTRATEVENYVVGYTSKVWVPLDIFCYLEKTSDPENF